METGIAGDDFPYAARCGISLKYALDIFPDLVQHWVANLLCKNRKLLWPSILVNFALARGTGMLLRHVEDAAQDVDLLALKPGSGE